MLHSDRTIILATPATIRALVAKAPPNSAFFVEGATELRTGPDTYLPLSPNVRVTRRAMLRYLDQIAETAARRRVTRGDHIEIELRVHGDTRRARRDSPCYFI